MTGWRDELWKVTIGGRKDKYSTHLSTFVCIQVKCRWNFTDKIQSFDAYNRKKYEFVLINVHTFSILDTESLNIFGEVPWSYHYNRGRTDLCIIFLYFSYHYFFVFVVCTFHVLKRLALHKTPTQVKEYEIIIIIISHPKNLEKVSRWTRL